MGNYTKCGPVTIDWDGSVYVEGHGKINNLPKGVKQKLDCGISSISATGTDNICINGYKYYVKKNKWRKLWLGFI
jgi:hypothetical protein